MLFLQLHWSLSLPGSSSSSQTMNVEGPWLRIGSLPQPNYIIYLKLNFKALNIIYRIPIHKFISPVQIFSLNFSQVFTCSLRVTLTNYHELGGIKLKIILSQFRRLEIWNQGISRVDCWRHWERSCSVCLRAAGTCSQSRAYLINNL